MLFPSPEIDEYLKSLTPESSELMGEIEAYAEEQQFPIVAPLVGRFLYQLAKISKSKMIFELGSGYGYSALWMAMAIPDDGKIICTEFDHEKAEMGMRYLERAKLMHKVIYEVGDAIQTFHRYQGPFDLIFCDLDKHQYPKALDLGLPRLRDQGLFVADNVLWSGRILDDQDQSNATNGIREFNQKIYQNPQLFTTIIPIRDGVSVSLKHGSKV
jgi:predicted O-methyltransferase YrrM